MFGNVVRGPGCPLAKLVNCQFVNPKPDQIAKKRSKTKVTGVVLNLECSHASTIAGLAVNYFAISAQINKWTYPSMELKRRYLNK